MKAISARWFRVSIAGMIGMTCSVLFAEPAAGLLRPHPDNPHYFTDGTITQNNSLRAVFLTGAHTWNNLVDMGREDPHDAFDFERYLEFLEQHHHNFIRMW